MKIIETARRESVKLVLENYFYENKIKSFYGMTKEDILALPTDLQFKITEEISKAVNEAKRYKTEIIKSIAKIDAKEIIKRNKELSKLEKKQSKNKTNEKENERIEVLKREIKNLEGELGYLYVKALENSVKLTGNAKKESCKTNEEYLEIVRNRYKEKGIELKPYNDVLKKVLYFSSQELVSGIKPTKKDLESMDIGIINKEEERETLNTIAKNINNIEKAYNKDEHKDLSLKDKLLAYKEILKNSEKEIPVNQLDVEEPNVNIIRKIA